MEVNMKKSTFFLVIVCTIMCVGYIYATCFNMYAEHYCWSCDKKWGEVVVNLVPLKSGHPQTTESCPTCQACSPHLWSYDYDFCEDHD